MKLRLMLAMVLMAACTDSVFASVSTEAATALARRILGEQCDRIRFQDVSRNKADAEFFTVEDSDGGILVSGTGAPAMAMGLNWYLRYRCKVDVSWYSHDPVRLPSSLPVVGEPFTSEARVANRFFLNYCTFGYTLPWWGWKEWERFIDWMALNGINLPLAITGQESVWYKVWSELGLTDDEIRGYFTGPAHLPWHRMQNIDRWQGPLPVSWLDGICSLITVRTPSGKERTLTRKDSRRKSADSRKTGGLTAKATSARLLIQTTESGSWTFFGSIRNILS